MDSRYLCESCWRPADELFVDADGNHVCLDCLEDDVCDEDELRELRSPDNVGGLPVLRKPDIHADGRPSGRTREARPLLVRP